MAKNTAKKHSGLKIIRDFQSKLSPAKDCSLEMLFITKIRDWKNSALIISKCLFSKFTFV